MERWLPGVALLMGFIWIRLRTRVISDEKRLRKAIYAIFFGLAPFVILGPWLFKQLPFEPPFNLMIELAAMGAAFWLLVHFFLQPDPKE